MLKNRTVSRIFKNNGLFESSDSSERVLKTFGAYSKEEVDNGLPLQVGESKWEMLESPNRIRRSFKFKFYKDLRKFVTFVLEHQDETNHHGFLQVDSDVVRVEVYTHDLDEVTELDLEYARSVDQIYSDVIQTRKLILNKRKQREF